MNEKQIKQILDSTHEYRDWNTDIKNELGYDYLKYQEVHLIESLYDCADDEQRGLIQALLKMVYGVEF